MGQRDDDPDTGARPDAERDDERTSNRGGDPGLFPVHRFRRIWQLNGYFPANTRLDPTPRGTAPRTMRWQTLERADLAPVATAVLRAFDPDRHRLRLGHWRAWLGMEIGVKQVMNRRGGATWVFHDPERGGVMTAEECAAHYGYTVRYAAECHRVARKTVEDEWHALWFFEGRGVLPHE